MCVCVCVCWAHSDEGNAISATVCPVVLAVQQNVVVVLVFSPLFRCWLCSSWPYCAPFCQFNNFTLTIVSRLLLLLLHSSLLVPQAATAEPKLSVAESSYVCMSAVCIMRAQHRVVVAFHLNICWISLRKAAFITLAALLLAFCYRVHIEIGFSLRCAIFSARLSLNTCTACLALMSFFNAILAILATPYSSWCACTASAIAGWLCIW